MPERGKLIEEMAEKYFPADFTSGRGYDWNGPYRAEAERMGRELAERLIAEVADSERCGSHTKSSDGYYHCCGYAIAARLRALCGLEKK